jgi:hypothetical protein
MIRWTGYSPKDLEDAQFDLLQFANEVNEKFLANLKKKFSSSEYKNVSSISF